MFNFFITKDKISNQTAYIDGSDFNHIKNVLRMRVGEKFLISVDGQSHLCQLKSFLNQVVEATIIEQNYNDTSLPIQIHLFQALPKADKLELVIQKAVVLGAEQIFPVQTERCVVKIEDKKMKSKVERWNAIAESSAKQCKRAFVPKVNEVFSFGKILELIKTYDMFLVAYENEQGVISTKNALQNIRRNMKIGVLVGSEGGLSQKEVDLLTANGALTISLGKRILRTETASITALSILMMHAEMNL